MTKLCKCELSKDGFTWVNINEVVEKTEDYTYGRSLDDNDIVIRIWRIDENGTKTIYENLCSSTVTHWPIVENANLYQSSKRQMRFEAACAALQGLLSSYPRVCDYGNTVKLAIEKADELLAELDKKKE